MEIIKLDRDSFRERLDSFCELYHKVFTAPADRQILEQRYLGNPNNDLLMYVAVEDGSIIANYSAIPLRIIKDDSEYKAGLFLNTMTDPNFMGRSLFSRLATALFQDMQENGYQLIVGYPNYMANRLFNTKLAGRTICEIPTMKLDVEKANCMETATGDFNCTFDCLQQTKPEGFFYFDHSKDFLEWRFKNNKEKKYEVLSIDETNWVIYQKYVDEINITMLQSGEEEKTAALIAGVIEIAIKSGTRFITTWCRTNTVRHSMLERIGFCLSAPIRTFSAKCFDESLLEEVSDPRKWDIQMGDCNIY